MKSGTLKIILIFSLSLLGCSTNKKENPSKIEASIPEALTTTIAEKEQKELTLANALVLTLEKNPELESFSYLVRSSEARLVQAKLIPNPEISIAIEDVLGTKNYNGAGQSQNTLQLSQLIELGGKRSARTEIAELHIEQYENDYKIKKTEVLTGLTDKFIYTASEQELLKLASKAEDLSRKALKNIQKRSVAGGASILEESKAKVVLARSHIEVEHVEHKLKTSKKELANFWGVDEPVFSTVSADLFKRINIPDYKQIDSQIDQSPEIIKWVNEKRLREAEQKLVEAKSIPNLTLGGGPRRIETSDSNTWVFQFSMPLPVFDRNQGGRQEAENLMNKTILDETAAKIRLKTVIYGIYQELKHSEIELEAMKNEIIPQAEKSLKIAEDGYDQGRFSYLELLDAQRTLLDVHRENIETAYSYHSFVNSLERLLGVPLR